MENIIQQLNNVGKQIIDKSFQFKFIDGSLYAVGKKEIMSRAKNVKNNSSFDCNVLRFFDDLWLYARIDFKEFQVQIEPTWDKEKKEEYLDKLKSNFIIINGNLYGVFISISIFQGDINDNIKTQLFRAEWDNYPEQESSHPQPHWHLYPHKYSSNIHQTFEEFLELGKKDNDFNSYIGTENIKDYNIINLSKFHFAMNGQWSQNMPDIHSITEMADLTNWFSGLLNHLKKELEYVKKNNAP